ncbi:MAG: hypothetical protein HY820_34255 [Acidobacteria bacterium]|nr:hypothetical protein [Acidobacteriota bacterium]
MIRFLSNDFWLKLLSLAVAVVLWLAIQGDANTTTAVSVHLQYRNIPPQLEISSDLVDTAYIEVRGPSVRLNALNLSNAAVAVDLSAHQRPGERTYSIVDANVKLPPGVTFLRSVPSQIRVRLEPRVSKQVPVMPRFENLPAGYGVVTQNTNPAKVQIVGPESRVNTIDHVETDAIEVDIERGVSQVLLAPVFSGDPLVHFDQKTITVAVKVELEKRR